MLVRYSKQLHGQFQRPRGHPIKLSVSHHNRYYQLSMSASVESDRVVGRLELAAGVVVIWPWRCQWDPGLLVRNRAFLEWIVCRP